MPKCSECGKEFEKSDNICYCDEHEEYFHFYNPPCDSEHSQNKHGAYYREVSLINGKLEFI